MMIKLLVTGLLVVGGLWLPDSSNAQELEASIEGLVSYVEDNPIGDQDYWFQMLNIANQWDNMILVFGYGLGGDSAACEAIVGFAETDSPNREFRCVPAN